MPKTALKKVSHILPDKPYLTLKFRLRMGYWMSFRNPQTFNEKLQWLKLYDRRPEYTTMVDKYEAKKYVASIIGEEHIIPTLGVWDRFEDIDFDSLPEQFVLKCTHDSGGIVICRDKSKLDIEAARKKIDGCLKHNYYWDGREWPYKNVKPRIIAEQYIDAGQDGLVDYKFFCFNGKPRLLYISVGLEYHQTAKISFYGIDGKETGFYRKDYLPFSNASMPVNFEAMKETAKALAGAVNNSFVRVDLYSVNSNIYFSELTFSPCGGMLPFEPATADKTLGDWLELSEKH